MQRIAHNERLQPRARNANPAPENALHRVTKASTRQPVALLSRGNLSMSRSMRIRRRAANHNERKADAQHLAESAPEP